MNGVFELGGELVRPDVAHNLMRLIAEGSGEDDEADMALRRFAATTYYSMLDRPILPDILVCVICWVLGEYGYLIGGGVAREPETDPRLPASAREETHSVVRYHATPHHTTRHHVSSRPDPSAQCTAQALEDVVDKLVDAVEGQFDAL